MRVARQCLRPCWGAGAAIAWELSGLFFGDFSLLSAFSAVGRRDNAASPVSKCVVVVRYSVGGAAAKRWRLVRRNGTAPGVEVGVLCCAEASIITKDPMESPYEMLARDDDEALGVWLEGVVRDKEAEGVYKEAAVAALCIATAPHGMTFENVVLVASRVGATRCVKLLLSAGGDHAIVGANGLTVRLAACCRRELRRVARCRSQSSTRRQGRVVRYPLTCSRWCGLLSCVPPPRCCRRALSVVRRCTSPPVKRTRALSPRCSSSARMSTR